MAKKCRLCGSIAERCGENVFGEEVYECTICHEPGHHSRFEDVTLFTEITKSPEVLANSLVYYIEKIVRSGELEYNVKSWGSTIIAERTFETYQQAYEATVAKLNEVCND